MLQAFRFLFLLAAILCVAAAILITASLFIADRAPQSPRFLAVSLCCSGIFVATGWLAFGIRRHVAAIASQARAGPKDLSQHAEALLVHLVCGGAVLCVMLALIVYAILARIDQGFAVFG